MRRFVLAENIDRFQRLLEGSLEAERRRTVETLLLTAQRDLALLDASLFGVGDSSGSKPAAPVEPARTGAARRRGMNGAEITAAFQREFEASPRPYMLIDPGPGLAIVDINGAYARATMTVREQVVGRSLFEVFPDNPQDGSNDGVRNLFASLKVAAETGKPHTMAVQRYDVRDPSGQFVLRYWQPCNSPLFGADGRIVRLLHYVEDVTHEVVGARGGVSGRRH